MALASLSSDPSENFCIRASLYSEADTCLDISLPHFASMTKHGSRGLFPGAQRLAVPFSSRCTAFGWQPPHHCLSGVPPFSGRRGGTSPLQQARQNSPCSCSPCLLVFIFQFWEQYVQLANAAIQSGLCWWVCTVLDPHQLEITLIIFIRIGISRFTLYTDNA